jgi:hypothetical protein
MKLNLFIKGSLLAVVGFLLANVFYQHAGDFLKLPAMDQPWFLTLTQKNYKTFSETVSLQAVTAVEIVTVNTDVDLHQKNIVDGRVSFTAGVNQKNSMQIQVKNHILLIKVNGQPGRSTTVSVVLPTFVQTAKMISESGDIRINESEFKELSVNTVAGDIRLQEVNSDYIALRSVSGDIHWVGMGKKANITTISGDVSLKSSASSPDEEIQTVSGDIKLIFIHPLNAELDAKSMSGDVDIDKSVSASEHLSGLVKVRSVSGDIQVRQ